MSGYGVDWVAVRDYLYRRPVGRTHIIAGTPEWQALDDDDPQKLAAVIAAGSRWVLEEEIDQIHRRREAQKAMALGLLEELPWKKIRQQMADRDAFYRKNPDLKRKAAS
ncbi:DUF2742 domain-containing protein [Gordonia sp. p3-SID1431]|uniref:DUF2742 domain-containing protein n=1 Tax=Gordonia sp. p3-SID1431 TaxID=2916159 RepID=UPI0021A46CC9|nr:DUF2742 domain-containing protein [Gordonia sp. p3-SID1431]MCT1352228.1 DUF2742 domain-containing protein [Gordonia sp. p3-SID1431]